MEHAKTHPLFLVPACASKHQCLTLCLMSRCRNLPINLQGAAVIAIGRFSATPGFGMSTTLVAHAIGVYASVSVLQMSSWRAR
eukprot:2391925-Amphidinium_carterae.1